MTAVSRACLCRLTSAFRASDRLAKSELPGAARRSVQLLDSVPLPARCSQLLSSPPGLLSDHIADLPLPQPGPLKLPQMRHSRSFCLNR
jgi:hypothetical protein